MASPVDIHIHLTDEDYKALFPYIKTYLKTTRIILVSVAVDFETSVKSLKLAEEFQGKIVPFIGIHPQNAEAADLNRFWHLLDEAKGVAAGIGEIGLDRRLGSTDKVSEAQFKAFRMQLEVAEKLGKPVSIHSRGTLTEILGMLPSYSLKGVLLHWFAGDLQDLREANSRGYYASFGPALVYSKNKRQLVASMSSEYILTETDGPVHFGGCFGGRMALPSFLPSVLFTIASILKMPYDDTVTMVHRNSESYLGADLKLVS
ncbi:MAG: TatD family hydrolase [Thaumarchaeota archaeon]|nr:TatD family hydrolase [Nitrososphaerota archaeon]MCL5317455.1 TatD family hydrolase [Nitrososphaerota archaeon]